MGRPRKVKEEVTEEVKEEVAENTPQDCAELATPAEKEKNNNYYAECKNSALTLADALESINENYDMKARAKIAAANGIKNYNGDIKHDNYMLSLMKVGKLERA